MVPVGIVLSIVCLEVVYVYEMQCISPIQLPVRIGQQKYKSYFLAPCGKCDACRFNKRNAWIPRLLIEAKQSVYNYFVTLTYRDEDLPHSDHGSWCVNNSHLTNFIKKLRHTALYPFKFFAVSEYGEKTGRPHYHLILFNYVPVKGDYFDNLYDSSKWLYGNTDVRVLSGRLVTYITKYILKDYNDDLQELTPTIMRCSKGLGSAYLTPEVIAYHRKTMSTRVTVDGYQYPMHRYYRDKIFSDEQKYELFQNFLDRQRISDPVFDDPNFYATFIAIHQKRKSINDKDLL